MERGRDWPGFYVDYPKVCDCLQTRAIGSVNHITAKRTIKKQSIRMTAFELDFPRSERVPSAILKIGYTSLAMKDKKRASSAFEQVVTLYPRSPEAGKASDKLAQLKECPRIVMRKRSSLLRGMGCYDGRGDAIPRRKDRSADFVELRGILATISKSQDQDQKRLDASATALGVAGAE